MQQENMKTLESLEDFRHFSEKELEIRFDQLKKQIVPADKTIREQAEKHWGHVQNRLAVWESWRKILCGRRQRRGRKCQTSPSVRF